MKKGNYSINPENHKGLIWGIARKVKNSYPSIDIQDIIQEINILIIQYSSPIYSEFKGTVINGNIDISLIKNDIGEILHINTETFYKFNDIENKYVSFNKKIRKICYNPSMGEESTFITNHIAKKIFQTIKYSGLIDCQSTMIDSKQCFEYMNPISIFSSVNENNEDIELINSKIVSDSLDSMYNNEEEEENSFDNIISKVNLKDNEKDILTDYFVNTMTLEKISEKFNLTKERIRQIKEKAINKMKHNREIKAMV